MHKKVNEAVKALLEDKKVLIIYKDPKIHNDNVLLCTEHIQARFDTEFMDFDLIVQKVISDDVVHVILKAQKSEIVFTSLEEGSSYITSVFKEGLIISTNDGE